MTNSKNTTTYFVAAFSVLVILELICGNIDSLSAYHYITKPSINISLIIFLWAQRDSILPKIRPYLFAALVFCLMGDVLLMFVHKSAHFFTAGLLSFLIGHIMYIFVFAQHRDKNRNIMPFAIFLLLYAAIVFYIIKDGLGAMLIPVIIYILTILTMAAFSYLRKAGKKSYQMVLAGAFLFMISDSLLAINKFSAPFPLSSIGIMLTYAVAQLLIVLGVINEKE